MVKVKKLGIILEKTRRGYENAGVLNPAAIREGDDVHMFYRAVRKGNYSTIGYCRFTGSSTLVERHDKPIIIPENDYERQGVEDPRIVKIDGVYYMVYVAYDGSNVVSCMSSSDDLKHWKRLGIITPQVTYGEFKLLAECCADLNEKYFYHYRMFAGYGLLHEKEHSPIWDKDVMLFPKKRNGKFAMLHRIYPGIQYCEFETIEELNHEFWKEYIINLTDYIVLDPKHHFESAHVGGGCPPIETKDGWLMIYHAVEDSPRGFIYHAAAALLDYEDPTKIIGRLDYPLFSPEEEWETHGYVNNVVFPTATAQFGDDLIIYYGAADARIALASVKLPELLKALKQSN